MTSLRLALSQYPITAPATLAAFAAKIDAIAAQAAANGAQLLVLPEYASMEAASAFPGAGNAAVELQTVTQAYPRLLALFTAAATRHRIWLLPGTLPCQQAGRIVNRAPLISPQGETAFQDKTTMTRFEAEQWGVSPGAPSAIFRTPWGLLGIAICYDVEFPPLVRAQIEAGAWLILAPSCTDSLHGFNRVRLSARARALENQCFVAITPTIGTTAALASLDKNQGYAAIFGPVDRGFPADGIIARGTLNQPGLIYASLDPAKLPAVRAHGAVRNHRDWPAAVPACTIETPSLPDAACTEAP